MKKQNVVLKVAIGLVLGIGAMMFAPKAAQASTPCANQNCNSICGCPGNVLQTHDDGWNSATMVCVNCDGQCPSHEYYVHVTNWTCHYPFLEGGDVSCQTKAPYGSQGPEC